MVSGEHVQMDKGFQDFLEEEEYKRTWKGKADFRILNAFKACEKARDVILHEGGFDEGSVESIEKNLEYAVDHDLFDHTPREIDSLFDMFHEVLDEERGDPILLTGNLDQVNFTLEEAYNLLQRMSVWSASQARRGEGPKK